MESSLASFEDDSSITESLKEFNEKLSYTASNLQGFAQKIANMNIINSISQYSQNCKKQLFLESNSEYTQIRNSKLENLSQLSYDDIIELAFSALSNGDFYTAALAFFSCYEQSFEFTPKQKYIFSIILMHYKAYDEARKLLSECVSKIHFPFNSDAHYRLGICCRNSNDIQNSTKHFTMALNPRLSPWISKSDVLVQLSHNSFLSNDITAATHHIDDSEEVTQATLHQRAFLALATEFRQDMKSALNKLKDSSMTIYSPVLLYLQGRLSYKLSNAAEAQKALNKSLQLDPTNSLTWCAMGNVYFLVSQFDDASICYHKALLYDHNMVEPYQNLCLLRRIGYVSQDPQKELSILKQSPLSIYTISKQNSSTVTLSSVIPMVVEPDDKVELKSAAAIITEMYLDDLSPLKALQEFEVEEGQDVMEEEEEGLEAKEGEVHHHEEEEAFGREDPERADNEEEEETEVGTELM